MTQAAWTCLLLPLGATVLITLLGGSISRRTAGWISTLTSGAAFAAAVVVFVEMLSRSPHDRSETSTAYDWLVAGNFRVGFSILTDHLLAFEITSVVLLVAAVGGVILGSHSSSDPSLEVDDARA